MQIKNMLVRAKTNLKDISFPEDFYAVDMHIHSRYSDSYTKIDSILRKAKEKNIGIAITDHNEIKGAIEAHEKAKDTLVIPGIEISTQEGPHILVYFTEINELKEFFENQVKPARAKNPHTNTRLKALDLIQTTNNYDCLVSIAHPFSPAYTNVPKSIKKGFLEASLLNKVHAIEVINGAMTKRVNRKAIEYAEKLKKNITGGSDSHSLFEMGKILTLAKAKTPKEFLSKIKANESLVIGKPVNQIKRIPSLAKSAQKHMYYFLPSLPDRINMIVKRPLRYHKPKIIQKLRTIKRDSLTILNAQKDRINNIRKK